MPVSAASIWAHEHQQDKALGLGVWLLTNAISAMGLAFAGSRETVPLLLRWDFSPGIPILALLALLVAVSLRRRQYARPLSLCVALLAGAILVDLVNVGGSPVIFAVAVCLVLSAEYVGFGLRNAGLLGAIVVWIVGAYVMAVYAFNLLTTGLAMRFFSGGEIL
jgi:hypothetical protein